MDRTDVIREIAALVRRDHWAAAFAVGYLTHEVPTEVLSDLLEGLRDRPGPRDLPNHLELYKERWGLVGGQPPRS